AVERSTRTRGALLRLFISERSLVRQSGDCWRKRRSQAHAEPVPRVRPSGRPNGADDRTGGVSPGSTSSVLAVGRRGVGSLSTRDCPDSARARTALSPSSGRDRGSSSPVRRRSPGRYHWRVEQSHGACLDRAWVIFHTAIVIHRGCDDLRRFSTGPASLSSLKRSKTRAPARISRTHLVACTIRKDTFMAHAMLYTPTSSPTPPASMRETLDRSSTIPRSPRRRRALTVVSRSGLTGTTRRPSM